MEHSERGLLAEVASTWEPQIALLARSAYALLE